MFKLRLLLIVCLVVAAITPRTARPQGAFGDNEDLVDTMKKIREQNKNRRNKSGQPVVMAPEITDSINPMSEVAYFDLLFQTPPLQMLFKEYSTSGRRHFDKEEMMEAIKLAMQRKGFTKEDLERNLKEYVYKLDRGMKYHEFLQEIMACKDACGQTLAAMAIAYMVATADDFMGIVLFNFGKREVESTLYGDQSHGDLVFNNGEQLDKVLIKWRADSSKRIGLDARASIPGGVDLNTELSSYRVSNVVKWFMARGVPEDKIDFKWLGSYGPLLDYKMSELYRILELYQRYSERNAPKSRSVNGQDCFDGLNQSVCMFVY